MVAVAPANIIPGPTGPALGGRAGGDGHCGGWHGADGAERTSAPSGYGCAKSAADSALIGPIGEG